MPPDIMNEQNMTPNVSIESVRQILFEDHHVVGRPVLEGLMALPSSDVGELLVLANEVRERFYGNRTAVEVLYNAKRGGCSEDCSFCSQAARFASGVEPEILSSIENFLDAARGAHARGAGEFCIVVAVRGPSDRLIARVIDATKRIKAELPLKVPVSLGILEDRHLPPLVEAGVDKVNHNIETSRRFFPSVCNTHSFDERWATCERIKRSGLELCCGGIIGMGETIVDRLDLLCALQELEPNEVPINFLNPRPGTPFADRPLLEPVEALRFVAVARIAMPRALIRFAGGREITLQGLQDLGMMSGASGLVLGDYLTTEGRNDNADFDMLNRLGLEVAS